MQRDLNIQLGGGKDGEAGIWRSASDSSCMLNEILSNIEGCK